MKLETIDYRAADSAKRFVESLRETGFGVLSNHPIDKELVERIYTEWQAFFNSEAKNEFMFNRETHDGFFPASISETAKGHTVKDIKEYYHVYPWGRIPDSLRANILAYYEKANALASELLQWIETYSPEEVKAKFSIPLPEMIANSHKTLLRILHYGDMLQEASDGYFPSTSHRVINPEGTDKTKSRISLPLFLHPHPSVVLSERYTADSYLMERLRELGVL